MGGEGSIAAANNSLKNNRKLLKNKRKGALSGSYANIELKEFPKATPEQLEEIRKRMLKQNKVNRTKQLILLVLLATVLILLFF